MIRDKLEEQKLPPHFTGSESNLNEAVFRALQERSLGGIMRHSEILPEFTSNATRLENLMGSRPRGSIATAAPFQRGKSSLMNRLRFPDDVVVVRVSVADEKGLAELSSSILGEMAMNGFIDDSAFLSLGSQIHEGKLGYKETLQAIRALMEARGKKVAIVFDELSRLPNPDHLIPELASQSEVLMLLALPYHPLFKSDFENKIFEALKRTKNTEVFHMEPESHESIAGYLDKAFNGRVRFTPEAIKSIRKASGGWPKEINYILGKLPRDRTVIDESEVVSTVRMIFAADDDGYRPRSELSNGSIYFPESSLILFPL